MTSRSWTYSRIATHFYLITRLWHSSPTNERLLSEYVAVHIPKDTHKDHKNGENKKKRGGKNCPNICIGYIFRFIRDLLLRSFITKASLNIFVRIAIMESKRQFTHCPSHYVLGWFPCVQVISHLKCLGLVSVLSSLPCIKIGVQIQLT